MNAIDNNARKILDFWFGTGEDYGNSHARWFRKDEIFDAQCRTQFAAVYETAAAGGFAHWQQQAHESLALIVLLDQLPRNMFRGAGRAFATDALALAQSRAALARGFDRELLPVERQFIYLPLEHSEVLADQDRCLALMHELAAFTQTRELHIWAEKHRVIIQRFGRFPHRNKILGRASTAAETEFLKEPGSSF